MSVPLAQHLGLNKPRPTSPLATSTVHVQLDRGPTIRIDRAPAEDANEVRVRYSDFCNEGDSGNSKVLELTDIGGHQYVIPFAAIVALVVL